MWVGEGTYKNFDMSTEDNQVIANMMVLKLTIITEKSVFVGHVHLQHAGTDLNGKPSIGYHINQIPKVTSSCMPFYLPIAGFFGTLVNRENSFWPF